MNIHNLQGLAKQKANIHRAQSVDLTNRSPLGSSHSEATFDLEESFRRAEAARAMSMDASRVPGIESWPVDCLMSGEPLRSHGLKIVDLTMPGWLASSNMLQFLSSWEVGVSTPSF